MAAADEFEEESISKWESLRLKTLSEQAYNSSDLKLALKYAKRAHHLFPTLDGVSEMLTAFKILTAAENPTAPHWYKILELEPFSHINSIKKQYKKLALILHPDKNTFVAAEEAFKLVNEAFRILSDKIRRKEYDMKLRIAMQAEAAAESGGGAVAVDTFWTACSTCRLLHQFERKYVGHNLMCPSCKKSFKAVEVNADGKKMHINDDDNRNLNQSDCKRKMSSVGEIMKRSEQSTKTDRSKTRSKVAGKIKNDDYDDDDEMMTLAEMQKLVKTNVKDKAQKSRSSSRNSKPKTNEEDKNQDIDIMTVEDSDFYDFDNLRVEKSFKKGQIWALYDDDDGMPRLYGLINEVVSTHPFEVDMSWLDPQTNLDDELISLEKTGFHISCGRFKVSKKTFVTSLNVFSHLVNCERAAREVYRIYPKKGSVWALYSENGDKRLFEIVVFLTSYSEVHGLSMGYLEKVDGFKTIFRRREISCRAVKWLEKHEVGLFSHQILARKLCAGEIPNLSGDFWELDPASLPTQLLTSG